MRNSAIVVVLSATLLSPVARAQDEATEPVRPRFAPPPAPDAQEPVLGGEVHIIAVAPISTQPLCPPPESPGVEVACVFEGGGGVGVSLERRWPRGLSIMLGYEAWFLDSGAVYELAIMQVVRAMVRYLFFDRAAAHPFVGFGLGAMLFGDTLSIAAVGGAIDIAIGVEIEVTETLALVLATPVRIFTTTSFVSPRDGTRRAEDGGFNSAVSLHIGLSVLAWD
jgi:hypothetical protein